MVFQQYVFLIINNLIGRLPVGSCPEILVAKMGPGVVDLLSTQTECKRTAIVHMCNTHRPPYHHTVLITDHVNYKCTSKDTV